MLDIAQNANGTATSVYTHIHVHTHTHIQRLITLPHYNKYTFEYVKIFNEFLALEFYKLHLRTNYVDIRYFKRLMRLDKI